MAVAISIASAVVVEADLRAAKIASYAFSLAASSASVRHRTRRVDAFGLLSDQPIEVSFQGHGSDDVATTLAYGPLASMQTVLTH